MTDVTAIPKPPANPLPKTSLRKLLQTLLVVLGLFMVVLAVAGVIAWQKYKDLKAYLAAAPKTAATVVAGATSASDSASTDQLKSDDIRQLMQMLASVRNAQPSAPVNTHPPSPLEVPIQVRAAQLSSGDPVTDAQMISPHALKTILEGGPSGMSGVDSSRIQEFVNQLPPDQKMALEQALKDPEAMAQALREMAAQQSH